MAYGCFVEFPGNLCGLAPVKHLTDKFVSDSSGVYQEMQTVLAKVKLSASLPSSLPPSLPPSLPSLPPSLLHSSPSSFLYIIFFSFFPSGVGSGWDKGAVSVDLEAV